MNLLRDFLSGTSLQVRRLWKALVVLYLPIVLLFILVGILSRVVDDASLAFFLRDVVATGKLPFFAGFVAQLAAILWSASLTVCFFALYVLRQQDGSLASARRLLLHGGVLTLALLLDDVFLFHEEIAPDYLRISEKLVVASYGILGIVFVFANWKEILSSEYLILMLALGLFGVSILLDALPIQDLNLRYFWEQLEIYLEDGSKFAGIATWLLYFARYSSQRIQRGTKNAETVTVSRDGSVSRRNP
jgi:hypothetical protein